MQNTRQRDTDVEVSVRRVLHRHGFRYRIDAPIPGVTRARPDIVFSSHKVAIFIDGCFWHRCPQHRTEPKHNADWWREKLDSNVARDRRHDLELARAGWTVLRYWEHEDPAVIAREVEKNLLDKHPAS